MLRVDQDRVRLEKFSSGFFRAAVRRLVFRDNDALDKLVFKPLFDAAEECDAALSIGGDNYCYGDNRFLYLIDRELRRRKVKTVLWGCSVEPSALTGDLLEDLRGFDKVFTRESLSYEALRAKGLPHVDLHPDPAFALDRKETVLPEGFEEGNTVGINVSPLVMGYERKGGMILENILRLTDDILRDSDMKVALIPHVVRPYEDDRMPLGSIYERFKDSGKVLMVDDRPAEELKDIIARCRFMVSARTHACIAAYSSGVPTLALGYSVKAKGIATDIFGTDKGFVIPVQSLDSVTVLQDVFASMVSKEKEIRGHLEAFMPDYIGRLSDLNVIC